MEPTPDILAKLERNNASASAAALIREAIIDGRFKPGQRLKENDLAEAFGIVVRPSARPW